MSFKVLKNLLIIFIIWANIAVADELSITEKNIVNYVDTQQEEQLKFLERVVNINSGTLNFQGVRAVGDIFKKEFEQLGFKTYWVALPTDINRAGHLFAEKKGTQGKKLLLIGHLDTVFPKDSPFQRIEYIGKDKAKGPGTYDMKGGDLTILYALKALQAAHALDNATITVALMGDEEDPGKPTAVSRKQLIAAAQQSDVALDFESAPPSIARRGISLWVLKTQGKQGHSSQIFRPDFGAGAIFEAARTLDTFRTQLAGEQNLTFNPGLILGGTDADYDKVQQRGTAAGKKNVIAQTTIVTGDIRFMTPAQEKNAEQKMQAIVAQHLSQTDASITFQAAAPAMPPTQENLQLFNQLNAINKKLGDGSLTLLDPGLRGAGDISYIAEFTQANLAGLGPAGTGEHSVRETIDLPSLPLATKRAALLIYYLTH